MKRLILLTMVVALVMASFACAPAQEAALETGAPVTVTAEAPAPTASPATAEAATEAAADYAALTALLTRISTDYQPGTAGCSLQAAKLAGQLLDWYAKYPVDASRLAQAMAEAVAGLSRDAANAYVGQFDDIYSTAILLTEDYAIDYLESAGYTAEAYPYSHASVEALFSGLQAGIPIEMQGFLRRVEPTSPISIDMDGDGSMETVTVTVDEDKYTTDVAIAGAKGNYSDHLDTALMFLSAYVGDAWLGDGSQALFLCGDEASDDYETVVYRLQNGELQRADIFGSLLDANEKGVLTIECAVDVFGTYGGVCQYQLRDGFTFSFCSPYRVQNDSDNWAERKLTVICDSLPVILQDGTNEAATLPKGTELVLLETDQKSYAVLEDANGDAYRVDIERHDDDWQWYLNGMPEDQCFEPLLYAG